MNFKYCQIDSLFTENRENNKKEKVSLSMETNQTNEPTEIEVTVLLGREKQGTSGEHTFTWNSGNKS